MQMITSTLNDFAIFTFQTTLESTIITSITQVLRISARRVSVLARPRSSSLNSIRNKLIYNSLIGFRFHPLRTELYTLSIKRNTMPKAQGKRERDDEKVEGAKKQKPKTQKAPSEPSLQDDGWMIMPKDFIYRKSDSWVGRKKIAAFDLDGTLIFKRPGSKGYLPEDENDFSFFSEKVPKKLKEFHDDGYGIVIFSNQGMIRGAMLGDACQKIRGMICQMLKTLNSEAGDDIPIQVVIATGSAKDTSGYRKPGTKMWEYFVENMNDGVQPDVAESFFVGDAAGRDWDIGDAAESDKKFAEDIGLKFMLPEDLFGVKENKAMGYAFLELSKVIADSGIDNAVFKARSTKLTGETVLRFPEIITTSKQLNGIKGVGAKSKLKVDEYLKEGRLSEMDELKGGVKHDVAIGKEAEVAMKFL